MKFELTEVQEQKIAEWVKTQEVVYTGPVGGRYTYQFTPTSIGVVVKVRDCVTKTELDITDYDAF